MSPTCLPVYQLQLVLQTSRRGKTIEKRQLPVPFQSAGITHLLLFALISAASSERSEGLLITAAEEVGGGGGGGRRGRDYERLFDRRQRRARRQ